MKKNNLLLTFVLLFFISVLPSGYAQLYVDEEGNTGVGVEVIPDARLKILNTTEDYTLKIENLSPTDNKKYGIHVKVDNQGTGVKRGVHVDLDQKGTANAYGYEAQVGSSGSGISRAFFAQVKEGGSGEKQGFYSTIRQGTSTSTPAFGYRADIIPFGSGIAYGFYSAVSSVGTGRKEGIHNELGQPANSTSTLDGIYTNMFQNGTGQASGITTYISSASTAPAGRVYGDFISIYGSASALRYGVYANINGGEGYAGYFIGNVQVDGQITQTSDENLKENIEDMSGALAIIDQISPKTYNFRQLDNHGNDPKKENYGFLAQDIESVLPDLVEVIHHPGRTRPVADNVVEGDGSTRVGELVRLEEDEEIKSINYIAIIPILTQAIKEQQTLIEDQKALIEALQARVEILEE